MRLSTHEMSTFKFFSPACMTEVSKNSTQTYTHISVYSLQRFDSQTNVRLTNSEDPLWRDRL